MYKVVIDLNKKDLVFFRERKLLQKSGNINSKLSRLKMCVMNFSHCSVQYWFDYTVHTTVHYLRLTYFCSKNFEPYKLFLINAKARDSTYVIQLLITVIINN